MKRPLCSARHQSKSTETMLEPNECQREILLTKLVRERLYDASCFLLSPETGGLRGEFREPNPELTFSAFAASLTGRVISNREARGF